jgi:hypothetical protein
MKWILSLVTMYLVTVSSFAQSIDLNLISNLGGASQDGTIEYSLGEVIISGNVELSQGFHQNLSVITQVFNYQPELGVVVFPNPATTMLVLSSDMQQSMEVRLLDNNGILRHNNKINNFPYLIDLSMLAQGVYYLEITSGQSFPTIHKIVKIQ